MAEPLSVSALIVPIITLCVTIMNMKDTHKVLNNGMVFYAATAKLMLGQLRDEKVQNAISRTKGTFAMTDLEKIIEASKKMIGKLEKFQQRDGKLLGKFKNRWQAKKTKVLIDAFFNNMNNYFGALKLHKPMNETEFNTVAFSALPDVDEKADLEEMKKLDWKNVSDEEKMELVECANEFSFKEIAKFVQEKIETTSIAGGRHFKLTNGEARLVGIVGNDKTKLPHGKSIAGAEYFEQSGGKLWAVGYDATANANTTNPKETVGASNAIITGGETVAIGIVNNVDETASVNTTNPKETVGASNAIITGGETVAIGNVNNIDDTTSANTSNEKKGTAADTTITGGEISSEG